jgi:multidrug efflux pump subunit AcrA (membrane-fusion protein)
VKYIVLAFILFAVGAIAEVDLTRKDRTVILDEAAIKNLGIETVEAEEIDFEQTVFALGRIEAVPAKRAVVSSRIPGRVIELKATLGDSVAAGSEVARVESRQPGDPPPSIALKAPLGGLVTESAARLGEPVEPDKALLEITDLSEVLAIARVPEHEAGTLKPGTPAHIVVSALAGKVFDGELLRFGPAADRETGTIDAIFRFPNPELLLRPGMRAEFSIVMNRREGVMSIPHEALQGDAAGRFVYIKDYELKNAFAKTAVQLGEQNDRFVEVTHGLLAGDEVVTRGAYSLAFAGKGSVSLREALDAAHGHPHNEDGSEMSKEQIAAANGGDGLTHGAGGRMGSLTMFLVATNILLLILLVGSAAMRRRGMFHAS